jgi:hypothetical protein
MEFRIADTFTDALAKLTTQEQKAAKTTAFDLQMDPSAPGLQFHRIDKSKDPNFWSIRVNRDLRIIVHKTASSFLLSYIAHHDDAYTWAARRRIEAHPKTGAIQIVEVRERVEEITLPAPVTGPLFEPKIEIVPPAPPLFESLLPDDLLTIGVPEDWIQDVRQASEDRFLELASHLPAEAAEALLEYAATGILHPPPPSPVHADPFAHPDALRRFRVVENIEELQRALDYPWEKWTVFLHPSQHSIVEGNFSGPARVAGSAGTGKTIVALHRAARLAQTDPKTRVLLTTFSRPLANALERKLRILIGEESPGDRAARYERIIKSYVEPRPLSEWHEDLGSQLWWKFPVVEPPYGGTPLDSDWPEYHTHYTRIPEPKIPVVGSGKKDWRLA